jgi:hypothetical protein
LSKTQNFQNSLKIWVFSSETYVQRKSCYKLHKGSPFFFLLESENPWFWIGNWLDVFANIYPLIILFCIYNISKFQLFRKMRYGHLSDECLFLEKLFFRQKLSSFLVKIPCKVCPRFFFPLENYGTHPTSYSFRILDINFSQNLKKTLKFWVFWPFIQSSRPRRGHPHSKFWKVVELKLFLMSVHNLLNNSSCQFLSLKISLTKTLQPDVYVKFQLSHL